MSPTKTLLVNVFVLDALLSFALTGLVRRYALARGILDRPNARSSHKIPTPRGGGLAIVAVSLLGVGLMAAKGLIPWRLVLPFVGGGVLVAVVGWLDDRRSLSAAIRAIVHGVAAVWALWWLGGVPQMAIGPWVISLGSVGSVLAVPAIVWLINLYNFMDGIDGFAGAEAVIVSFTGGLLALISRDVSLALLAWAVTSASLGFLVWNWPPARIFMGDVGSGFLGYSFAVLALVGESHGTVPALIWCLLLGVFVIDATLTLIRRVVAGERWYEAHRSHVYQLAVQVKHSHGQVTLALIVIDVALSAAATVAWLHPGWALWVVGGSAALLVAGHVALFQQYTRRLASDGSRSCDSPRTLYSGRPGQGKSL